MNVKKVHIIYYFLKLRWSRLFSSDKVSRRRRIRWEKNLRKSVFYRRLSSNGEQFPIVNKDIFMEYFDDINTVGIKKQQALDVAAQSEESRDFSPSIGGVSVGLSSGTSGNKGIFLTTAREKAIWVAAVLDRVIGFSLRKRKVAFFLRANNNLYESVKSNILSFSFFDIKKPIEDHISTLQSLQADILVAQPSVLLAIASHYDRHRIKASFNKVISVAEVLEQDQKEYFEQVFQCTIDQVYQCTEGFLGYTCSHGQLHFNEDWLHIEKKYLDIEKTRFHPIITDYMRSSQPVIRYELNDIIHEGSPCSCGSKATVIDKIEGRADDVFQFISKGKEINIYPDFIRRVVILASDQIRNYQIILKNSNTISVYVDTAQGADHQEIFAKVKDGLIKMLTEYGIENINVVNTGLRHDTMSKFTRIKNEHTKKN